MGRDGVRHLVRRVAIDAVVLPRLLIRRVVRQLGLVEVQRAAVAVPERLELLEVLDEEAVRRDVAAVHDEAVSGSCSRPVGAGAVIGAPQPADCRR